MFKSVLETLFYTFKRRDGEQIFLAAGPPSKSQANPADFEWDPSKAARNRRKHGVSFHEEAVVFGDPLALTYHDPDHSNEERRFITVGISNRGTLLIVAHADRGEKIRSISARRASLRERRQYEED